MSQITTFENSVKFKPFPKKLLFAKAPMYGEYYFNIYSNKVPIAGLFSITN